MAGIHGLDIAELTPYRDPRAAARPAGFVPVGEAAEKTMTRADMARFGVTPAAQGQGVMYGTRAGIATDIGAAEGVRRASTGVATLATNQSSAYGQRAAGMPVRTLADIGEYGNTPPRAAATTPPSGPPAGPPRPPTGYRARQAVGEAVGRVARGVAPIAGAVGRLAVGSAPLAAGAGALQAFNTPTEDMAQRMGIEQQATHVPQVMKDLGIRALGTAQDVGNALTFGMADRVGNAIAGNGFNRSYESPAVLPGIGAPSEAQAGQPSRSADPRIGPQPSQAAAAPAGGAPKNDGIVFRDGNSYSGRNIGGDVQTIREGGVDRAARGGILAVDAPSAAVGGVGGIGTSTAAEIEQRAMDIGQRGSQLRRQLDAYGPGARNPDGTGGYASLSGDYGQRLERQNAETTANGLRFDARLAAGRGRRGVDRAGQLEQSAQAAEALPVARAEASNKRAADLGIASLREGTARAADETARRGQDIGLIEADRRNTGALAVEKERGRGARDIAALNADSRVAAAEARGIRPLVVEQGEVIENTKFGPMKVRRPAIVIDGSGNVLDIGTIGGASAAPRPAPAKGEVIKRANGEFRFKGGDPSKPESWERLP